MVESLTAVDVFCWIIKKFDFCLKGCERNFRTCSNKTRKMKSGQDFARKGQFWDNKTWQKNFPLIFETKFSWYVNGKRALGNVVLSKSKNSHIFGEFFFLDLVLCLLPPIFLPTKFLAVQKIKNFNCDNFT